MKVFDELVQEALAERWRFSPVTATFDGVHDYDDKLDRFTARLVDETVNRRKAFLDALDAIPEDSLDLSRRIDAKVLRGALRDSLVELEDVRSWRKDPALYLQTGLYGVYILMTRDFADTESRARSAAARAEAIPTLLADAMQNLENPPRVFCETALEICGAAKGFFQGAFRSFAAELGEAFADAVAGNAVGAIESYEKHIRETWLESAGEDFAIGREAFDRKLRFAHGLNLDAEQLLQIGEEARRETVSKLADVAHEIEPGTPWPALIRKLQASHPQGKELLAAYADEMKRARRFVEERDLVTIPEEEELEIVETPEFDRPTTPYAALLPPAPFERRQRSFFYVTPPPEGELEKASLQEHSFHSIPVTALHEAYPGHHLQLVTANRRSSAVRKVYSTPVMVEGWALYCEEMMYEQGFYPDAPTRLFQLKDLLWRACRVILDVQLHTGGMTYEAAVRYLMSEACLNETEAAAEVRRYCAMPTYPMSYLIGRNEFFRLRHEVELRRRRHFSLKQFHDAVLSWGSIPVNYIRDGVFSDPAFAEAA